MKTRTITKLRKDPTPLHTDLVLVVPEEAGDPHGWTSRPRRLPAPFLLVACPAHGAPSRPGTFLTLGRNCSLSWSLLRENVLRFSVIA